MSIISITNFKGGVGKTTAAIAIATVLSRDYNVLLIDADQNASALQWASYEKLPFDVRTENAARPLLMSGKYDHVVVDSQVAPDSGEIKALCEGSNVVIVPTTTEALSVIATGRIFAEANNHESLKALICMVPPAPQTDGKDALAALKNAGLPSFKNTIRRSKVYSQASEIGTDMSVMRGRMPIYWRDWVKVADELLSFI